MLVDVIGNRIFWNARSLTNHCKFSTGPHAVISEEEPCVCHVFVETCHMSSTKTLNVYLPDALYSEISGEARRTQRTKGQVVRERLQSQTAPTGAAIADLFGVADDLPKSLSTLPDKTHRKYGADGHR